MRALTIIVFLLSTIIFQAAGQGRTGVVGGNIQDANGTALESVTVALVKSTDSTTTKQAITDKNGQFHLDDIPLGKYPLTVTHVGYSDYNQSLELTRTRSAITLMPIALKTANA